MSGSVPSRDPSGYRVGDIVIDLARRRVRRNNRNIHIGKLSYKLLVALAMAAPRVVTRDELAVSVWDGRYVNPATIKRRVVLLRKALGDNAHEPVYLEVIRGQGYALIPRVEPIFQSDESHGRRPISAIASALGLLLIGAMLVAAITTLPSRIREDVAVLPFENLSPDPEDAFFATGLHEEVINQLAQLDDLRVVSRSLVQRYASGGFDVQEIVQELGVGTIMEGTVRYTDDRVRISVQLTDAGSSELLWTQTYERDFADIFEIQREIATSVAGALGVTLQVGGDSFRGAGTDNIEAYEAYLQGVHSLTRPEGRPRAISFFRRATMLDPDYSTAWAQLSFETVATSWTAPPEQSAEILARAYPLALRALELDPKSHRAASILGTIRFSRFDWIGGEESHAKSIALRTNRFTLAQHANLLVRAGRIDAARSEYEIAESVEPLPGSPPPLRVQASIAQGRYAEARELAERESRPVLRTRVLLSIALNEGDPAIVKGSMADMIAAQPITASLYSPVLRQFDSPEKALEAIRAAWTDRSIDWGAKRQDIALLAAYFGDAAMAFESISEDARLTTARLWALWYPVMSGVRRLPEFSGLAASLNLDDYWRAYGWADMCAPIDDQNFSCS